MKIGFLIIGSEVLDGKVSDLNTKLLSEFLRPHHLEINEALVARDETESILDALNFLTKKNDLIITTGGLGPTKDDITKKVIATFLNRKINFSEASLQICEENFQRMKFPFPGKEHEYCFLPDDFIPLSNINGFAPGLFTVHEKKLLFSAPGVPREFKCMLETHLLELVRPKLESNLFIDRVMMRTKYIPEEKIFNEVDPRLWDKLEEYGEVSSLPVLMGVDIGVKIKASTPELLAQKVLAVKKIFEDSPIKKSIWNSGNESLEEKIVMIAIKKKIKFGFAESATGGLCSHRITNVSGSSQCFMGSVICYDEEVKEHVLGVSSTTIREASAVSLQCAEEMAQGLKEKLNLDVAISITGYAGPSGGSLEFPVGSVCIGTAVKNVAVKARSFYFKGDRELLKQRFTQAALHILLEELEKIA